MTGIPRVNIGKACIGNNCKLEINFNLQDNANNTNNSGEQDQAVGRNGFVRTGTFLRQEEDEAMIKIKNDSTDETLNIEEEYESESESDTEINTNYNGLVKNLGLHYKGLGAKTFYELSTHDKKRKYDNGHLKVKKQTRFKQIGKNNKVFSKKFKNAKYTFDQIPTNSFVYAVGSYYERENSDATESMENGQKRYSTFYTYSGSGDTRRLAQAGFYHDQSGGPLFTRCFKCDANNSAWSQDDDVLSVHRRMSPNCPFLVEIGQNGDRERTDNTQPVTSSPASSTFLGTPIGHDKQQERLGGADRPQTREQTSTRNTNSALKQIPDSNMGTSDSVTTGAGQARQATKESEDVEGPQQIRSAKYLSKDARIKSFCGFDNLISQNRLQMAEAGFYYTGSADLVCCFHCGIGIQNWNNGDDPWVEHARWSSRCEYIRNIKGEKFILSVQNKHQQDVASRPRANINLNPTRRENSPGTGNSFGRDAEILVVLQEMGFSVKKAREAILAVRQQTGSTVLDKEKAITLFLDGEERRTSTTTSAGGIATTCMQATDSLQCEIIPSGSSINDLTASRSWGPKPSKAEKRKEEQIMCKVCLDNTVGIVFIPCGHLVTCADCGPATKKCPKCLVRVNGTIRAYI